MKKIVIITLFLVFGSFLAEAQWTVKTVPDPKDGGGMGYVSNPDNILKSFEVDSLNAMIKETEDSATAQIAVIMLESIGDEVPKNFATELFNLWGIGSSNKDNGLLILFVLDQRRIEFETGYGTEQILTDAECFKIQQDYMVPSFKEGNYGAGMLKGVKRVVDVLMNRADEITETATTDETVYDDDYYTADDEYDYPFQYRNPVLYYYLVALAIACGFFLLMLGIAYLNKNYFVRYQIMRIFRLYFWFILFPIPFVGLFFFTKHLTEKWRNTPRISAKTGKRMHLLSKEEEDEYLESGQISEERVKSVDYDVWVSDEEGDVLIQAYKRWFSKYSSCTKCKYKTYYMEYNRTIRAATYSSSGKGEKRYRCANCGHSRTVTYTIPKKTKSSSSSSSSSSWGGGSSSWSSGGSSWGGGSSGGGGAGSSW